MSFGSRGDMEPFLALGHILKSQGWQVVCAMPEQLQPLAADADLPFESLGPEFLDVLEGPDAKAVMGQRGSMLSRLRIMIKLHKASKALYPEMVARQWHLIKTHQPDLVVYHPKTYFPLLWGMANPGKAVILSPVPCLFHAMDEYPVVAIPVNLGPFLNRLSYKLINRLFAKIAYKYTKGLAAEVGLGKPTYKAFAHHMLHQQPVVYGVATSLFPQPGSWPAHARVVGFHERPKHNHWQPAEALTQFIEAHNKILFISFGSMVNNNPSQKTTAIIQVLTQLGIPAIINTSWGGLEQQPGPGHILFVNSIPYDWLFPKIYAVVHHGGAGTTHMAMKYGCASLIIPHIADQFFWNNLMARQGVGPKGMAIKKLTTKTLAPLVESLWQNQAYKAQAVTMAESMAREQHLPTLMGMLQP